jgi:hypothetical protein
MLSPTNNESKLFREVVHLTKGKLWKDTMVEEMESLHKNETWDLFKLPNGRKPIDSKWMFKKKLIVVGQVEKFKIRLVAKLYSQVEGVDFEFFSLVAKLTSNRVQMSLVVEFDLEMDKMYVKTTFLHGYLEEEIYIKQPGGFVVKGKKYMVCK